MTDNRHEITSRQLFVFTTSAQIGIGIISLPAALAGETGHDGWISVVLGGVVSIAAGVLLLVLMNRYRDKSIYEINRALYGKYLGFVFNLIIVSYLVFAASIGVRIFGNFVNITLLPRTPPLVLVVFILTPTLYAAWYGLKTIARFMSINFLILTAILFLYVLVFPEAQAAFLQPVGAAGMKSVFSGIRSVFFAYIGFELVVILYPNIKDKKYAMKNHILANIFSMLFFALTVALLTAVFGEHMLKRMTIPLFNLARVYNAPVLERVDLYFIALWFIALANSIRAYFFSAYYSLSQLFAVKNRTPLYVVYILVVILLSRLPKDFNDTVKYAEILNLLGMGVIVFFLLCLPLSFIRKKGVKNHESSQ